jgi:hypothetical protein
MVGREKNFSDFAAVHEVGVADSKRRAVGAPTQR